MKFILRGIGSRTAARMIGAALLVVALLGSGLGYTPAGAFNIITVDNPADAVDDNGVCTLREAITAANSNAASGATPGECGPGSPSGADQIHFAGNYTISVGSELPQVSTPIDIFGNGVSNTIIQASACNPIDLPGGCTPANHRVFFVGEGGSAALGLYDLTVRHGNTAAAGAGLYINGTLNVVRSTIEENKSGARAAGSRWRLAPPRCRTARSRTTAPHLTAQACTTVARCP